MAQLNFTDDSTTIKVNDEEVLVLALSSDYFKHYFFDDRYPMAENIELPVTTTIADFKRMLAILTPEERRLDDGCIEAILILADRFAMDNVLELCRSFLLYESRKPKLFKFRMAHKYGWKKKKEAILRSMRFDDFNAENFVKNANEYAMLDDEAKAAITAHHAELVFCNSNENAKVESSTMGHRAYRYNHARNNYLPDENFMENAMEFAKMEDDRAKAAFAAHHSNLASFNRSEKKTHASGSRSDITGCVLI